MLSQQRRLRWDRRSERLHGAPPAVARFKDGGEPDVAAFLVELGHESEWENALHGIDGPGYVGDSQRVFLEFSEIVSGHRKITADAALAFENVRREHLETKRDSGLQGIERGREKHLLHGKTGHAHRENAT